MREEEKGGERESEGEGEEEGEGEWVNEVKRGKRAPANVSETGTSDFVLWAAKVICSLDMQSQWFSSGAAGSRGIPDYATSIVSHLVISKFRLLKLEGHSSIGSLLPDRPDSSLGDAPPRLLASFVPTSRYYKRKQNATTSTGDGFFSIGWNATGEKSTAFVVFFFFSFYLFFFFFFFLFPGSRRLLHDCVALSKEIANAKLRFLPRWNPCRRQTAGYRRGTRIKNQYTNAFGIVGNTHCICSVSACALVPRPHNLF